MRLEIPPEKLAKCEVAMKRFIVWLGWLFLAVACSHPAAEEPVDTTAGDAAFADQAAGSDAEADVAADSGAADAEVVADVALDVAKDVAADAGPKLDTCDDLAYGIIHPVCASQIIPGKPVLFMTFQNQAEFTCLTQGDPTWTFEYQGACICNCNNNFQPVCVGGFKYQNACQAQCYIGPNVPICPAACGTPPC
jgi:hypothetical protein